MRGSDSKRVACAFVAATVGGRRRPIARAALVAAAGAGVWGVVPTASSATFTWAGASGNWNAAGNWVGNAAPATDGSADVVLAGTGVTATADVPYAIDSLTFGPAASNFNVAGGALTIGPGGLVNQGGTAEYVANPIVLAAAQTWDGGRANGGSLTVGGTVNTGGQALVVTGSNSVTVQGNVTGGGSLAYTGTGTLVLNGTNTYSGGTTIAGGTVQVPSDGAIGNTSSPITFAGGGTLSGLASGVVYRDVVLDAGGGRFQVGANSSFGLTMNGRISGGGPLTLAGVGGLNTVIKLAGHDAHTGGTTIGSAIVVATTDSLQGNVALADAGAVLYLQQDTNGTFAGDISGGTGPGSGSDGSVQKFGAGIVALTGNNTFSSDTLLNAGGLEVAVGTNNLSPNSRLLLNGRGVVQVVGGGTFARTFGSDVFLGGGGFAARNGKLTVNLGGQAAPVPLGEGTNGPSAITFGSATANSVVEWVNPIATAGGYYDPATLYVAAGTGGDMAVISGAISGVNTVQKAGPGTLKLTAASTYAGQFTVQAGTLILAHPGGTLAGNGIGVSTVNVGAAGTLQLGSAPGENDVLGPAGAPTPIVVAAGGTLTTADGTTHDLGILYMNGGTVTSTASPPAGSAALVLNGPVTVAGTVTVPAANATITAPGGVGLRGTIAVNVSGGSQLLVSAALADQPGSAGALTKIGLGTLTLSGANTYGGGVNVSAGILEAADTRTLAALLPNGPGTNTVAAGAVLAFDVGATTGTAAAFTDANVVAAASATTFAAGSYLGLNAAGGSTTFAAPLAGPFGLLKVGPNTLSTAGANTYTGPTNVSAGTLAIATIPNGGVAGPLGASTAAASNLVVNGGQLLYTGATAATDRGVTFGPAQSVLNVSNAAATVTFGGPVAAAAANQVKLGPGTVAFTSPAGSSFGGYAGGLYVLNGGVVLAGGTNMITGTLRVGNNGPVSEYAAVQGPAFLNVSGGTTTVNGTLLLAENGGVGNLYTLNLLNGATLLSTGTAHTGNGSGNVAFNVGGGSTYNSGSNAFTLSVTAGTSTTVNLGDESVAPGTYVGRGLPTGAGVATVNADNGAIVAAASGTFLPASTTVNLLAGGLTFNTSSYGDVVASNLSGGGGLTKAGSGTLTLSGTETFTGVTNASAGTITFSGQAAVGGVVVRRLPGGVFAAGTGVVQVPVSAVRPVLVTSTVGTAGTGRVDLANGDLIARGTTLAAMTALAAQGFAGGRWVGNGGLTSSAAAADARHLTGVGVIADVGPDGLTPLYATFDGQPVSATDVLARYTYYGDANLDGSVTAADYTRIDAGFVGGLTGWANGDFNYDGVVDGTDYALADNAFNQQAGTIAAPAAAVAVPVAVAVPEPAFVAAGAVVTLAVGRRRSRR